MPRPPTVLRTVAVACLLALLSPALAAPPDGGAAPGEARALASFKVERGFIDDPFAVSPDGKTIAYITTDGASRANLHLAEAGGKELAVLPYGSTDAHSLEFLDGKRLLAVDLDATTQLARARVFTAAGPGKERLGPATAIVTATVAGTLAIVTFLKQPRGKGFAYTVAAFRRDTLKPITQRRVLLEDAAGRVQLGSGGGHKPLYFTDDYTVLVALREGAFDAAHDIRKPDVEARVDVFSGKALREREIGDRVAHARRVAERARHDGQSVFVAWNEEVTELRLVDGEDAVSPLALPRPVGKYDPATLASQDGGAGRLLLSVTVDPVNAEAVAAKKADPDWIDLCTVDTKSHALTLLTRVDGKKRGSRWRLAGGTLAVLRKHKGFPRGGAELEIYSVP